MSSTDAGPTTAPLRIDTRLAHVGGIEARTGSIVPSIQPSTTFARDADYALPAGFIYGREGSPTLALAEEALRDLDGGSDALLFNAGLSAAAAVLETLRSGDRLIAQTVMYHGAQDWMRHVAARRGVQLSLFDAADPRALGTCLESGPAAMVWIETPVNPTWDVVDIAAAAVAAHHAGAVLVVDSTVAPPVTTRPLELGADLVLHSATKYLNGHSDVIGGAVITRTRDDRWEEIERVRKLTGGTMGPFDAWLLMRGLRTLGLRYDRCSVTAMQIARHFEQHAALEAVLYPGLESHAGHAVARRQMRRGYGGMLSLLIRGGAEEALAVAGRLTTFARATSLGGVESLVEHRASVEGPHSLVPRNLLRFSIGIEDPLDLINDLESALRAVAP